MENSLIECQTFAARLSKPSFRLPGLGFFSSLLAVVLCCIASSYEMKWHTSSTHNSIVTACDGAVQ